MLFQVLGLLVGQSFDLRDQMLVRSLSKVIGIGVSFGRRRLRSIGKIDKTLKACVLRVHYAINLLVQVLPFVVVLLHSIFHFVPTFFFPVELLYSNQVERIGYQVALYF